MRLLFLIHGYPPFLAGGHEIRCQRTVEGLRARGHEVTVLTSRFPGAPRDDTSGVLWRLRSKFSEGPRAHPLRFVRVFRHNVRVFEETLRAAQPDIVCMWALNACTVAFVEHVARRCPAPVVGFIGGAVQAKPRDRWLHYCQTPGKTRIRSLLKAPVVLLTRRFMSVRGEAVALQTATFLSKHLLNACRDRGMKVDHPIVTYAGVDPCFMLERPHEAAQGPLRFLFAARFDAEHDPLTCLDAAARLRDQGVGFHLTMAGATPVVSAHERAVIDRAAALGPAVRVVLRVGSEDMPRLYAQHDVVVSACDKGWIGNTALEGLASGCALIASGFEDVDGVLDEGENSLLYPFGDAVGLAARMKQLVNEPELRARLQRAGRSLVEKRFTMERYLDETEALLASVVASAAGGQDSHETIA